jgi:DNA-binding transcriptional LysR family regulator
VEYRSDSSLRARIDETYAQAGLERRICCEVDAIGDLVDLVSRGLGVSLLPPAAIALAGGSVAGLQTRPRIPRELALVTPLDRRLPPAGQALLGLLQDELQDDLTAAWSYRSAPL